MKTGDPKALWNFCVCVVVVINRLFGNLSRLSARCGSSADRNRRRLRSARESRKQEDRSQREVDNIVRRQGSKFAGRLVSLKQGGHRRRSDET